MKIIFNLFYSINISINNGISLKYEEIIYESLEKVIKLVIKINHEIMMIKYNLKIIFHHIPINSINY